MSDFDRAFEIVVGLEGGYVNDPADPGGETKFGISKRAFPDLDIVNLTVDQAKTIYLQHYWEMMKCDLMTWPMALGTFDTAVNGGVSGATRLIQRVCGVKEDGIFGLETQKAVLALEPLKALIKLTMFRHQMQEKLTNWPHDAVGWSNRILNILYEAVQ